MKEELNFSTWGPKQVSRAAKKLAPEVEKGDMPPFLYVLAHPGAKLGNDDKALLASWARGL